MNVFPIIKRITARNFWGQGDLYWELDPSVNVLVGKNGTGKTTVLRAIAETLASTERKVENAAAFYPFETFEVELTDGTIYRIEPSEGSNGSDTDESSTYVRFVGGISFETKLDLPFISTFDSQLTLDELLDKLLLKEFPLLQNELFRKALENHKKESDSEDVLSPITDFVNLLNTRFFHTLKTFSDSKLEFNKGNVKIPYQKLSSGEKQLLALYLNALLQQKAHVICLLDEPEISLHIDWQQELISDLLQLNPNAQLIIVTHSATTFFPHWRMAMKRIEELIVGETIRHTVPVGDKIAWEKVLDKEVHTTFAFNQQLNAFPSLSRASANDFAIFIRRKMKLNPDIFTLNMLIERLPDYKEAQSLMGELVSTDKIQPDVVTYNSLLKKSPTFGIAKGVIEKMVVDGIRPDIYTFSILLGKAKNSDEIEETEALRIAYRVSPNTHYQRKLEYKQSH